MIRYTQRARWWVAVLAVFALTLGACGSPDPTPAPPPPTPTEIPLLEEEDVAPEEMEETDESDEAGDEAQVEATAEPEEESDATPEPTEAPMEEPAEEPTAEPEEEPVETPEPEEETDAAPEPTAEPAEEAAPSDDDEAFLASITLSDGSVCLHAGRGATMAFEGKRVNYTCDEGVEGSALLGDMQVEMDLLTVEFGEFVMDEDDTLVIEDTELIEMRLAEVTLADGMVCLNAGQGATLAFDEGSVNFTCDESDEGEIVLVGDMTVEMDVLTATRGLLVEGDDGFELAETETVAVVEVVGSEP